MDGQIDHYEAPAEQGLNKVSFMELYILKDLYPSYISKNTRQLYGDKIIIYWIYFSGYTHRSACQIMYSKHLYEIHLQITFKINYNSLKW